MNDLDLPQLPPFHRFKVTTTFGIPVVHLQKRNLIGWWETLRTSSTLMDTDDMGVKGAIEEHARRVLANHNYYSAKAVIAHSYAGTYETRKVS